eukprot:4653674-Prymnesium_polylepis.1
MLLAEVLAIVGMLAIFGALPLIAASGRTASWMYGAARGSGGGGGGGGVVDAAERGSGEGNGVHSGALRDAMDVVRVLPLAACCVVFWCVYSQMANNFVLQGCQMDLRVFGSTLSPATLN